MKTMILYLVALATLLPSACSPSHRLARLIERHPELATTVSITLRDTVAIAESRADTAVYWPLLPEPLSITRGALEMEILTVHDTLYVRGRCKADTVFLQRTVPVTTVEVVKPPLVKAAVRRFPMKIASWVLVAVSAAWLLRRLIQSKTRRS